MSEAPLTDDRGHVVIAGFCPACGMGPLNLGSGGYVTCMRLACPNPLAADDLLHRRSGA